MSASLRRRGTLLLLLAIFSAAYGIQMLYPGAIGIHVPDFDGPPQFTPIDATAFQYAINTPSTILRIGASYYLWSDGLWFRSSSAKGIYWKTDKLPAELETQSRGATD